MSKIGDLTIEHDGDDAIVNGKRIVAADYADRKAFLEAMCEASQPAPPPKKPRPYRGKKRQKAAAKKTVTVIKRKK